MNRKYRKWIVAAIVVALLLAPATSSAMMGGPGGPGGRRGSMGQVSVAKTVISVNVKNPTRGTIITTTDYIGKIQPASTYKVYSEVSAKIKKTYFNEGDAVKAGDLLFTLDSSDIEDTVERAKVTYDQALHNYNVATGTSVTSTILSAEQSLNNAKNNYLNAKDNQLTTKDDYYDNYKYQEEVYNLTVGPKMEETLKSAELTLKSARLTYENTSKQLKKCNVYAPASGTISTRSYDESDMVGTNSPVYMIASDNMEVTVNVSSSGASVLNPGDKIVITKSGKKYDATITEVSTTAGSNGMFAVKATLDEAAPELLSGISVKVTVTTQREENALMVPISNVSYEENQPYVYLFKDGKAEKHFFTAGISNTSEIIAVSGLTDEDQIITTWHPDLADGVAVQLRRTETASALQPSAGAGERPSAPDGQQSGTGGNGRPSGGSQGGQRGNRGGAAPQG